MGDEENGSEAAGQRQDLTPLLPREPSGAKATVPCPRASFGLGTETISDRQTSERLRGPSRWHCLPGWKSQP